MLRYQLGTLEASEALIKDLYIDLRAKVNAWSEITCQTPQARMGYIGQHLVSVVTGFPGGKSGARGYDLVMKNGAFGEIKTCYRVDQLGQCYNCGAVVSSLETQCAACGSKNINRKDDSKWLISLRNEKEFEEVLDPLRYYFVLFEFADLTSKTNNDIEATIWEVDPNNKGFAFCMVDYYLTIRAISKSKAPFNMWPHDLKFLLTQPTVIYKAIIHSDGTIDTDIFPTKGNSYIDKLPNMIQFNKARTMTPGVAKRVLERLVGDVDPIFAKADILRLLQQLRREKTISNAKLCDLLAEEIYLPRILPLKREIPSKIRAKYIELQ